jgi:hypothetical protein
MRVFVYWNLHKGLWSVKALDGPDKGRVIDRVREILLNDAEGKVYEAGRQRVLRERKKNVHAGIVGTVDKRDQVWLRSRTVEGFGDRITYNPYKYSQFVHTVDESPFEGSAYALLTADRAVFVA